MKLQRIVSRKVGGKTYYKWQLTIPPAQVEQVGWKEGQEIAVEARGEELRLRPHKD